MEQVHNEKWLLSKGWTKNKGYKVDHEVLSEGDYTFFDSIDEFAEKCTYYTDPNNEEFGSDDLDKCIEIQENYDEDNKNI